MQRRGEAGEVVVEGAGEGGTEGLCVLCTCHLVLFCNGQVECVRRVCLCVCVCVVVGVRRVYVRERERGREMCMCV